MTYSREAHATLYSKVFQMFLKIRDGSFDPDLPAVDRIVIASAQPADSDANGQCFSPDPVLASDSESSAASELGQIEELNFVPGLNSELHAFDDFPGIPASALMVHNLSGVVHVVNEDDTFLCGRLSSRNYKCYEGLVGCNHHLEACAQCLRASRNAGN